jgi:predicted ATPase/DNA-binding CsgD family transcriptional regulator/DNA-binding XRE family transcriptional regulator
MSRDEGNDLSFGERLRRSRLQAGLTQSELAERSGLSVRGISDLERGLRRAPQRETMAMLASAIGITDTERLLWERERRRLSTRTSPTKLLASKLPTPLAPLVGRERESRAIISLLRDPSVRLITLTGTGGVGKTRLGIAVAHTLSEEFRDGVVFIDLTPIQDPAMVLPTIAKTIDAPSLGDQPLIESVTRYIGARHVLLLLDNCEHVVESGPEIASILLKCPHLHVLATSRRRLNLAGEQEYLVLPMQVPDASEASDLMRVRESEAIEFFRQCARAVRVNFDVTEDNARNVVDICRRLDGLPLAIELAAARIRMLSLTELVSRLDEPLQLLTGGGQDRPSRHHTLRDTIQWSYELLEPDEQWLFRHLSIFVGGWTLSAVEEICRSGKVQVDVFTRLASLVDKSLVTQCELPDGTFRFRMLETVSEFGLEQLEDLGEKNQAFQSHASHYTDLVEQSEPGIRGHGQRYWFERLSIEQWNIRAVLTRALNDKEVGAIFGQRLCAALTWYWFTQNQFREARDWLELAVVSAGESRDTLNARLLVGLGMMRWRLREIPEAHALIYEGVELLKQSESSWDAMFAVHQLAHLSHEMGEPDRAIDLFHESMNGFRELDDEWGVAVAHCCVGRTHEILSNADLARWHLEQAFEMLETLGDEWFTGTALQRLGDVDFDRGLFYESAEWYRRSLNLSLDVGDDIGIADVLIRLGQISLRLRDAKHAAQLFGAAQAIHETYNMELFAPLRSPYKGDVASMKRLLGTKTFDAQWEAGRQMSVEVAVDHACNRGPGAGSRVKRVPGSGNSAGLTGRELEVLRLVATGYADREIAEILFISHHTVMRHVSHILQKLNARSRTEAAVLANERNMI